MSYKPNETLLLKYLGASPTLRIIDFFLDNLLSASSEKANFSLPLLSTGVCKNSDMQEIAMSTFLNSTLESKASIASVATEMDVPEPTVRKSISKLIKATLVRRISISVLSQYEATSIAKHNLQGIQKLFNATQDELKPLDNRK